MDRRARDAAEQANRQSEKYRETVTAFEAALKYSRTCGHERQLEHRVS